MNDRQTVGRPSVVPGEASIQLSTSIEVSLYRQIRARAQQDRSSIHDVVRAALRVFTEKVDSRAGTP